MTREEAIRELEKESCYECTWGCESPVKCTCPKCNLIDALKMAIEALKEQITTEEIETVISNIEDEFNDLRYERKEQYSYRAGYNDGINRAAILLRCFLKEKEEIK